MGREAKISLLGLFTWDNTLFGSMSWPDAFTAQEDEDAPALDKDAFLDELLSSTAELEVIYPDPAFMKSMIGSWSKTKVGVWNHLYATTQYEYNPIENYDRIEDGTDTDTHSGTDTYGNVLARTGTDTTTDTPDLTQYEAAYDSAASGSDDGLVASTRQGGENVSEIEYGSTDTNNGSTIHGHKITAKHDLHVHGNIGTVTAQKMIQEEREIAKFNLYETMISDFKSRFCILVY